ncbi:MAG: tetratricopeptide repeat protein [Christensenellales bacterium]|jgi:tetratricopeptide (TPR) repeat protein
MTRNLKKKDAKVLPFDQNAGFYFRQAVRQSDRNNYYDALSLYRKAYEKDAGNQKYVQALAYTLTEMACYEESNQVIFSAFAKGQKSPQSYFILGCNFMGLHDFEKAEDSFEKYASLDPNGEFAEEAEDLMLMLSARETFFFPNGLLDVSPGLEDAERGKFLLDCGEYKKAAKHLKSAVEKNPRLLFARNNLSLAYFCDDKLDLAIETTREVLQEDPDNIHASCNLAIFYNENHDMQALEQTIDYILGLQAEEADDLQKIAVTLCELGFHEQACGKLEELLEYRPYDKKTLHYMAVALFNTDRFDEAMEYWRRIAKLDPENTIAPYYSNLAQKQKQADGKRVLNYYFQVGYDEVARRMRILEKLFEAGCGKELEEEDFRLLLWGLDLGDMNVKRQVLGYLASTGTPRAEAVLRQFILRRSEPDEIKKEVFALLGSMGAAEPYVAYVDDKISEVRVTVIHEAGKDGNFSVVVATALCMMVGYGTKVMQHAIRAWERFSRKNEGLKLRNTDAWAGALEYYTLRSFGEKVTKASVCKKYKVSLQVFNRRLEYLNRDAGEEE